MLGYATKAGFRDAAAWPENFSQANLMLPFVSESFSREFERLRSEALIGRAGMTESEQGIQKVKGDLVIEGDYTAHALLTYPFGIVSGSVYTMREDMLAGGFHLELERVTDRVRLSNVYADKVTIAGAAGDEKPIQITIGGVARIGKTSATAFPSLTAPDLDRIYFHHLRGGGHVRVAPISGALGSGDNIPVSSFEFSIENATDSDSQDSGSYDSGESLGHILEAVRGGRRKVSLKLGLARYNSTSAQFEAWRAAHTQLQASLYFTDGSSAATLLVPLGKVADGANFNIGGAGPISDEVTLECYINDPGNGSTNTQTGMSGITDEAQLTFA